MKRCFILILFVLFASGLNAQIIKGEVFLGGNLSQVDGDECYGYKRIGAHIGAGAMIPFGKKWDVSMEVLFNQKGAFQKQQYVDTIGTDIFTGEYKLRLNYVELPVLVHFTDKDLVTIGAGFSYGRLVAMNEYEHGVKTDFRDYNQNDFSVLVDLRLKIYKQLKFNFRYQYSMAKIRTRDFYNINGQFQETRNQFNNVLTFRLVYMFFEERSNQNRKALKAESL